MKAADSQNRAGCCPMCHGDNRCRRAASDSEGTPCWCEQAHIPKELLDRLSPADRGSVCVCPICVARFNQSRAYQPTPEAGDYYHDPEGRWVFTEAYHLRRGYCCGNGCRHCPFETNRGLEVACVG